MLSVYIDCEPTCLQIIVKDFCLFSSLILRAKVGGAKVPRGQKSGGKYAMAASVQGANGLGAKDHGAKVLAPTETYFLYIQVRLYIITSV